MNKINEIMNFNIKLNISKKSRYLPVKHDLVMLKLMAI
jgi:hypothetical protein